MSDPRTMAYNRLRASHTQQKFVSLRSHFLLPIVNINAIQANLYFPGSCLDSNTLTLRQIFTHDSELRFKNSEVTIIPDML